MWRLRISERVLLHLVENWEGNNSNNNHAKEPPFSLTQAGIAKSLNYSLERISTSLRELIDEGLVVMKKCYSRESGRFRSFYFPTQEGQARAKKIIDMLKSVRINVLDHSGLLKEMSVKELIVLLKGISNEGQHDSYELKEMRTQKPTYTSIVNHIQNDTFNVKEFTSRKGFELNKRMWMMVRDAYFDVANKYVVLTRNQNWQTGIVWLKDGVKLPFIAEFKYKIGGGSGGDGMVFMFYKRRDYWPSEGGNLGFVPGEGSMPGYGIEFDSNQNPDYNDPPYPHIALVKDRPTNHLICVEDPHGCDFKWHRAKISVRESQVEVEVDGKKLLEWAGELNRVHSGIGIAASTGGRTNWHIVDDIKISKMRLKTG